MAGYQLHLEIDLEASTVRKGAEVILLTLKEWDLLRVLVRHKNQTLSHKFLLQAVWGDGYNIESNYLYVHIKQLRRKLSTSASDSQYIRTVPKLGYQWVEPEEEEIAASANPLSKPDCRPPRTAHLFRRARTRTCLTRKADAQARCAPAYPDGPGGIGKRGFP
ncbi:MAG: winged helix-turn-helix transcriptional regulator [Chloroflexi bacterium]|nr:winged helix-turn-helix transcriptional regulator [Chloroflexota bacterium]